jgi:hypothetical protein
MHFEFFEEFADPYMKTESGRGIFEAGIVLGMVALGEAGGSAQIDNAPMFKQMNFGRMKKRDILRHLARIPELTRAYRLDYAGMIESLAARAGESLLMGSERELGVDGNFAFSVAFLNAKKYFWTIFKSDKKDEDEPESENTKEEL